MNSPFWAISSLMVSFWPYWWLVGLKIFAMQWQQRDKIIASLIMAKASNTFQVCWAICIWRNESCSVDYLHNIQIILAERSHIGITHWSCTTLVTMNAPQWRGLVLPTCLVLWQTLLYRHEHYCNFILWNTKMFKLVIAPVSLKPYHIVLLSNFLLIITFGFTQSKFGRMKKMC